MSKTKDNVQLTIYLPKPVHSAMTDLIYQEYKRGARESMNGIILKALDKYLKEER